MNEHIERIAKLRQDVERKKYLDKMLSNMAVQRLELEQKCLDLQVISRREDDDVEMVENNRIVGFLLNLFNKTEQVIEKERAEAYAAKVKYTTAQAELNQLNYDFDKYTRESYTLGNCETQLAEEIERYKLSVGGNLSGNDTAVLNAQLVLLKHKKTELEEAVQAGYEAKSKADEILKYLDKADDWNTADMFLGGRLADIAKHSNLDSAASEVTALQIALRKFKSELADVYIDSDISIGIDSFLAFADFFWDGIFSTLAVQNKIDNAIKKVKGVKYQIQDTINLLNNKIADIDNQINQANNTMK